jgi:short-subunit dehydrogenase
MTGLKLDGRTVLVTGATGGIGAAIARALHERGASLVLTGRRTEVLDQLSERLGERVEVVAADLADRDDVARLCDRAREVDVLVANAALPASGRIDDFTPEEIDRALDVNLRAPMQLARAAVPEMTGRDSGHLTFISSMAGKVASPGSSLYSSTKFGLRAFASALRQDLHASGVGVTTVFPGFVRDAGMFADADVKLPAGVGSVTPEQVAEAVVRGIEHDKGEIAVAPVMMRGGALIAALSPSFSARVQRRLGGAELSDAIARGQADKR